MHIKCCLLISVHPQGFRRNSEASFKGAQKAFFFIFSEESRKDCLAQKEQCLFAMQYRFRIFLFFFSQFRGTALVRIITTLLLLYINVNVYVCRHVYARVCVYRCT